MRFINGVEGSAAAASTTGGTKHKTKQKCRKVNKLLYSNNTLLRWLGG